MISKSFYMNSGFFYIKFLVITLLSCGIGSTNLLMASDGKKVMENSNLVLPGSLVQQANVPVSGVVVDIEGSPIPGVSVVLKGTNNGTVTDLDGRYQLKVPAGEHLIVFSFIGFQAQEIQYKNQRNQNVVLREAMQELDDVVVVGYGTQKKESVTGSISTISLKEVEQVSTPSISNAIAGKLPGIITRQSSGEPGFDAAQVFVRGIGTYGTEQGPLILVDGVERNMDNINTEEIESFSILKDASATAVYGVRGANGVILINTKRGTIGKPEVSFRSEVSVLSPTRMPKYIDGYEYGTLINEALNYAGLTPQYSAEDLQLFKDGTDPYFHPNVNWQNEILKDVTYQTINNLNIRGGSENVRYFTNVGYTLSSGLYKTDNLNEYNTNASVKRYNFRSNVDLTVSKSLSLEIGIGGIIQYGNYPGSSGDDIFNAVKITSPIMFPKLNPDGSPGGVLNFLGSNPWGMLTQSGYSRIDRNVLQGTFGANWDLSKLITKGLSVRGKFAYDHYYNGRQNRYKSFEVKQYIGQDTDGEDTYVVHREASALGYAVVHDSNRRLYLESSMNYERTFNDHGLTAMVLFNAKENINLSAANSIGNLPARTLGLAGRFTYAFQGKYLAEVNFGYNGSENFPKNSRFGFFPSLSMGWVVSKESFWNLDFINNLKLRGSYGKVGNDQIGQRFLFVSRINRNANGYRFGDAQQPWGGFAEDFIANPDVTWEIATKTNFGFDLGLWQNRMVLQVDGFYDKREDILTQRRTVPRIAGIMNHVVPWGNIGKVRNRGIDGMIELKNRTSGGLFYSLRGNVTYAKNEILENDQPAPLYEYLWEKGHPVGQPFGLVALGLFKDQDEIDNSAVQNYSIPRPGDIKYKDMNDDDVINDYDQVPIGYPRVPQITFGFGGTIQYKRLDVSLFFTGAAQSSVFLEGRSIYPFNQGFGSGNILREYYDNRWNQDHQDGYYPAVLNGSSPNNFRRSTYYMRDAGYLRLRNAEIGFSLSKQTCEKLKLKSVRLFANGMNLYTWDKVKIMDPESNSGTGAYPLQRSVNLGLQVNF